MSIIPAITEQDIRTFVGEQNFLKGQQYVHDGAIVDATRQGMTLKGYCYGSLPDPYRVQVTFDATSITAAICSCPVGTPALYGPRCCKHAAALLLTWHEKPEAFTEMDDLDRTLERRDKPELIALVKQLLPKQPEFAWQLTMPPPTSKRKTPVNLETYHEQVVAAFRYSGHEWHAADKVSDELFGIKHIGDDFARQHDCIELLVRLDKSRDGVLLTYIALDERDIERALELVKFKAHVRYIRRNGDHKIYTYDYDYQDVVFDVAQVAEEMRPRAAIDIYVDHVEYIIDQRERKKYQLACSYLAKVRTLYEKLGDSEGWTNYIADLRNRTKTLKTLQNEMAAASL